MSKSIAFNSITFSYPGEADIRVPVERAFAWADSQRKRWSPSKAWFSYADGWGGTHWCWAKGWWDRGAGRLVRIGAGAYGDTPVINREA